MKFYIGKDRLNSLEHNRMETAIPVHLKGEGVPTKLAAKILFNSHTQGGGQFTVGIWMPPEIEERLLEMLRTYPKEKLPYNQQSA